MISRILSSSLLSIAFAAFGHAGEPLVLENTKGKKLHAELLSLKGDVVFLRKENGKEFSSSLNIFSKASRNLIQETWSKKQENAGELVDSLNAALGHPVFPKTGDLWSEDTSELGARLKWPEESKTPYTSSYRLYTFRKNGYKFAGANPKTLVGYGDKDGKTESISIIFANKGDTLSTVGAGESHFTDNGKQVSRKTLKGAMRYDEKVISEALTKVLGPGVFQRVMAQGSKTVKVERWDFNGHAFLLAHAKDEYVSLRIVKSAFADNKGKTDRIKDDVMRERLKGNIVTKDNGDVYIDNIPMVDQGPKGYCAPATFERAMRHAGVASDMYLLATLATTPGGGTLTSLLYDQVAFTTRSKGGRTARELKLRSLEPKKIQKYIDKGVPILWQMCSLPQYNDIANARTKKRANAASWSNYVEMVAAEAETNVAELQLKGNYHICMIVGYNKETGEIAVSDSWGKRYTRRWIHFTEAEAVSNGNGFVIDI